MAKYHIGKDGLPHVCRAKKGNCPYGSDAEHFTNKEDATKASQERLEHDSKDLGFSEHHKTDNTPADPKPLTKTEINKYSKNISNEMAKDLDVGEYADATVALLQEKVFPHMQIVDDSDNNGVSKETATALEQITYFMDDGTGDIPSNWRLEHIANIVGKSMPGKRITIDETLRKQLVTEMVESAESPESSKKKLENNLYNPNRPKNLPGTPERTDREYCSPKEINDMSEKITKEIASIDDNWRTQGYSKSVSEVFQNKVLPFIKVEDMDEDDEANRVDKARTAMVLSWVTGYVEPDNSKSMPKMKDNYKIEDSIKTAFKNKKIVAVDPALTREMYGNANKTENFEKAENTIKQIEKFFNQ